MTAMSVVSSAYRKLLIQRPPTHTPSLSESISALRMIVSVYRLNRYGESIQPWRTPLPILNHSVSPASVNSGFLVAVKVPQ